MSYAEFYDSFLQHPLLLWAGAIFGLLLALSRPSLSATVRRYCVALATISLLDAWLTANDVPGIGPLTGAAASFVPLAFVLIGDFRFFLFIESAKPDGTVATSPGAWMRASAWTLLVPTGSQLIVFALGPNEPRVLFFVYEALFVLLSIGLARVYLPRRSGPLKWTQRVTRFVIAYYALWAVADAVILTTGEDVGFLLRVLPNVLYYGGLVPAIAWAAPIADKPREGLLGPQGS
ncbi:MAG: hypothetical protein OEN21_00735 [Myxococcales bacterium]|nr:hypothetical protein [Myxococcales bacterium]